MTKPCCKSIAPESIKTQKAREKLRAQWEELEKKITKDALQEKAEEIHRWISRHAGDRVFLQDKTISLFDENQNTATISQRVGIILQKVREDMQAMANTTRSGL
jgi:hypothetical protein